LAGIGGAGIGLSFKHSPAPVNATKGTRVPPAVLRPNFGSGLEAVRKLFANRYPRAEFLQESDVVDVSLIDEIERSGFIERLYGGKPWWSSRLA